MRCDALAFEPNIRLPYLVIAVPNVLSLFKVFQVTTFAQGKVSLIAHECC